MPSAGDDRLWLGAEPLLLASTSATRRGLLARTGLVVETEAPGVDERALEEGWGAMAAEQLARGLAAEKALAVSRRRPGRIVVGADQTLDCDGERLHQPSDRAQAARQIATLAGRTHALHAAVAIAQDGVVRHAFAESARLTMRPLTPAAIERYLGLAGADALASVGAYKIEGAGIHLFERIDGDDSIILGLPLLPLLAALRGLGLISL